MAEPQEERLVDPMTLRREDFALPVPKWKDASQLNPNYQRHRKLAAPIQSTNAPHEVMIDMLLANPSITQFEIARNLRYSVSWVSQIIGSDAFQERLASRKAEISDPILAATIEERLKVTVSLAVDHVKHQLEQPLGGLTLDQSLRALAATTQAAGMGGSRPSAAGGPSVHINVGVPAQAPDAEAWSRQYAGKPGVVIELEERKE